MESERRGADYAVRRLARRLGRVIAGLFERSVRALAALPDETPRALAELRDGALRILKEATGRTLCVLEELTRRTGPALEELREQTLRGLEELGGRAARALDGLSEWTATESAEVRRRTATARAALGHRSASAIAELRHRTAGARAGLRRRAARGRVGLDRLAARLAGFPLALSRLGGRLYRRLSLRHALFGGAVVFAAGLLSYETCMLDGCPDVERLAVYQPNGAPVLLDRHGEWFADLAPFERVVVSIDDLPEHVPGALMAIEDKRFFEHRGVDWRRVAGAALANLRAGTVVQGSSTIPMQLARNVFPRELPGTERTWRRKFQEVRVAREIERRFAKREILELYLNHIYFGAGAYGIEAAARGYFGKPASELTVAEAATLAALPKAPAHFDPRFHPERGRARRDIVISLMAEQGLVDAAEADAARETALGVPPDPPRDRSAVPLGAYFIDVVRAQLEARFGEALYVPGLRIRTTLDATAQHAAERELEGRLAQLDAQVRPGDGQLEGAVVVMEAATGEVLALVGGRDPTISRYNRAILGQRQLGSAFKPFVFAAALEKGYAPSQLILDTPLRMQLSRNDVWEPVNYDRRFEGRVSMREALVRSRNVPTVRLANAVGIGDVARTARAAGLSAPIDETPALALGTTAPSPLQVAAAYSTFATLGTTATPRFVLRVEHEDGTVVWEPERERRRPVMSPGVAFILTDMLRDAVDRGTGYGVRAAGYHGIVAGKTGTSSNATDTWFVGYTPDVVGAVWIGYDQPSPLGARATGGAFAAPVWGRIMRELYAERPAPEPWKPPEGVLARRVDPWTGLVLGDDCFPRYGSASTELFLIGHEPGVTCPRRGWERHFLGRPAELFGRGRGAGGRSERALERQRRERERELERQRRDRQRELERQRREAERQARRRGGRTG